MCTHILGHEERTRVGTEKMIPENKTFMVTLPHGKVGFSPREMEESLIHGWVQDK
jgi:hypothetical protein